MTDQVVTVENLVQIEAFLKHWSNVTLPKISWCFARNAVIVEDALKTLREKTGPTAKITKLQNAIKDFRIKKFGMGALDAEQTNEFEADVDEMRQRDEWKDAVAEGEAREELFQILIKEDSGVNLYKISSENFEKYNVGKDGSTVIPIMGVAFLIRHGIITLDEDKPAVNTPQVDAEA